MQAVWRIKKMMVAWRQEEGTEEGDHTEGTAWAPLLRIYGGGRRKEDWACRENFFAPDEVRLQGLGRVCGWRWYTVHIVPPPRKFGANTSDLIAIHLTTGFRYLFRPKPAFVTASTCKLSLPNHLPVRTSSVMATRQAYHLEEKCSNLLRTPWSCVELDREVQHFGYVGVSRGGSKDGVNDPHRMGAHFRKRWTSMSS